MVCTQNKTWDQSLRWVLDLRNPGLAFVTQQCSCCILGCQAAELFRMLLRFTPASEQQRASSELHDVLGADALRCHGDPSTRYASHLPCWTDSSALRCQDTGGGWCHASIDCCSCRS